MEVSLFKKDIGACASKWATPSIHQSMLREVQAHLCPQISLHGSHMLPCRQSHVRTAQVYPGSQLVLMKQGEPCANVRSGSELVTVMLISSKHVSYSHISYSRARSTELGLPCSSLAL